MKLLAVTSLLVAMTTLVTSQSVGSNLINMTIPGGRTLQQSKVTTSGMSGPEVVDAVVDLIGQSCILGEDYLFLRRLAKLETDDGNDPKTYNHANYFGGIWQVDEAMFRDTQTDTSVLRPLYAKIYDSFGIDWLHVTWEDLRKPLYSGLAAAIFVSLQERGIVPMTIEKQGTFAHASYHQRNTAFNFTRVAENMAVTCPNQAIDVAFLLDASVSSDDFQRMLNFIRDVVDGPYSTSSGKVRFGVFVLNHNGANSLLPFTSNIQTLKHQLSSITKPSSSGNVNVANGVIQVANGGFDGQTHTMGAKTIIVLTSHGEFGTDQQAITAGQTVQQQGVSVFTIGVEDSGPGSRHLQLMSTDPQCHHHVSISNFRELTDLKQLIQRAICREPMIAQGIVHCNIRECRNIAFPMTSSEMTLMVNMTCDDGNTYVTTRMAVPSDNFFDLRAKVSSADGVTYIGVDDANHKFLYANLDGITPVNPNCVATFTTISGIIHQTQTPACEDWEYPDVNPCLSSTEERLPYSRNEGMFIRCDFRRKPYLTKCPPGEPYYHADCQMCLGGRDSPAITGCGGSTTHPDTPLCGLPENPCTAANIAADRLFFACPVDEHQYLQCNIWGNPYVMTCPEHHVWRQHALTCEFENTGLVACNQPHKRYYTYLPDPHMYIDCGDDMVPIVRPCAATTIYVDATQSCSAYDTQRSTAMPVNYPHYPQSVVTLAPVVSVTGFINPVTFLIRQNFEEPCTRENTRLNKLFFPYAPDPNKYIQCDLNGDSFLKSCQIGFTFNPSSSTCVNGPVVG